MSAQSAPGSVSLSLRDVLLALAVSAVWGTNFVVIKYVLAVFPPLFLATLRFSFVLIPAVFFLKRPPVPWPNIAAYGWLIGSAQFGLMYIAMKNDITPGLASLVVQVQVIFTIGASMVLLGEKIRPFQWVAVTLAAAGLVVIALNANGSTTHLGLILVLGGALTWTAGNLVAKQAGNVNMLAYVVWAAMFSIPPLLVMSLVMEGPQDIVNGLRNATFGTWAAVLWQSTANSMFGYAAWGWLMARHPAATITPWALLVPVFGMGASAIVLAEPLESWKLGAAALVLGGLALNALWPLFRARSERRRVSAAAL